MTPVSRTLNAMAEKPDIKKKTAYGKPKKMRVIKYANFDLPSCKDLTMA